MVRIDQKTTQPLLAKVKGLTSGVCFGAIAGTMMALVLPSFFVLASYVAQRIALLYSAMAKGRALGPYVQSFVSPEHRLELLITIAGLCLALNAVTLGRFLRRCYTAAATEGAILWTACAYAIWTDQRWFEQAFLAAAAICLTIAIASTRIPDQLNNQSLLSSDRPIGIDKDDDLDRVRLADALVERIIVDDIPVLAIVGAYGDGKTSILQMMETRLNKRAVSLVRFKTSLPGDESTLIATLFNSIGTRLHRRFFMRRLRGVLNRYARILAGVVPSMPAGLKEIFADASQQEELDELTARLERLPVAKVIVMLDDMDRMQKGELLTLLKVVRGIENYPKLCFVCAFNKNALVETLVRVQAVDRISLNLPESDNRLKGRVTGDVSADDMRAGYQFLEKFFPVQVPVPKLDDKQIDQQFDKHFDEFASHYRLLTLPDDLSAFQKRFETLWPTALRPALHNVRKMKTYFNAIKMSFGLVQHEVDLIDFMCIELLRQEEPAIYEDVFRNRQFFYYPAWDIEHWSERLDISEDRGRAKHAAIFDEMFGHLRSSNKALVKSLLGQMFPKAREYFSGQTLQLNPIDAEGEADQQRRIHHPAHFMVYFALHVPQGYYGTQEFTEFLEIVNQKDEPAAEQYLRTYLTSLQSLKRTRFLERVSAPHEQVRLSPPAAKALARAIARESQVLEVDDFGIGDFGGARRVVFAVANRFSHTNEITHILEDVIANATTDGFAQTILQFSTDQEHNKIVTAWEHVDKDALRARFAARMKQRYCKGGTNSIYAAPKRQDWQALITWYRISADDVREYLADEFERRPASIGKHLLWLFPSITNSAEGKKFVDEIFPFATLKELATKFGEKAYSGGEEERVVGRLLKDDMEGGWPY